MKFNNKAFGKAILTKIKTDGLSGYREAATKAKISKTQLQEFASGKITPTIPAFCKVLKWMKSKPELFIK